MAQDYNSITLIGRLTRDPEVKFTQGGKQVANFSVAVNRYGQDAGADFINCVAWEKLADVASKYLEKGKQVLLSGRLGSRQWEKDGEKRTSWEVTVRELQMLNGRHAAASDAPEEDEQIDIGDLPF